ncbi:hypothetical protein [Nitrosopumilus sp.]
MARRVTIVMDEDIIKKLHERQARQIKESAKSISFSSVVNEAIRKQIK